MSEVGGNPWGREYTPAEWAAARRLGLADKHRAGPLIWASPDNPTIPDQARRAFRAAQDWKILLDAWEQESKKELR